MATDTGPLVATADFKASSFPEGTVYRLGQYLYYNFLEKILEKVQEIIYHIRTSVQKIYKKKY